MPTTRKPKPAAAAQAPALPLQIPAIGQPWPSIAGSVYAGVTRGEDGQPDAHLVLLDAAPADRLKWAAAIKWAEALGDGAHLPTRSESALLYANLREKFEGWHWTATQYSRYDAFYQFFVSGSQDFNDKTYEGRARAVRRFNLQSFNPSDSAAA